MEDLRRTAVLGVRSLSEAMESRLERYFDMHCANDEPTGLYNVVIKEIEKGLLGATMKHVGGNKVRAARILGINRNTLHKKLTVLELDNEY